MWRLVSFIARSLPLLTIKSSSSSAEAKSTDFNLRLGSGRQFSSNPRHDDENSPCPELGLNCLPSAGRFTTNRVDHWSGGFSPWGQSLRPCPKGPTFPWYRGHPEGLSRVPGTRKGSFHPQSSGSQTLGLQCAPPTPPSGLCQFHVINNNECTVTSLKHLMIQIHGIWREKCS